MRNSSIFRFAIIAALLLFLSLPALAQTTSAGENGAVASVHILATEVGIKVLREGGNAVDAAIAVHMALAVVHPQAGNIGGGGFFVIHMPREGISTAIDFREKAPSAASETMYLDGNGDVIQGASRRGYLASGVPGSVAGLWLAHQQYGSLPWERLLEPARKLAEDGFAIDYFLASSLEYGSRYFVNYPASAEIFTNGGKPWKFGELLVQKDLAHTISLIMQKGRDGFYKGETAEKIAADMRDNGGLITAEDLAGYEAVEREPIRGSYRGFELLSMPPPSSGGVLLVQMLNMLEPFDLAQLGHNSAAYIQLLTEVEKLAYADRAAHLGDSDYYPVPTATLISKEYAARRARSINLYRSTPSEKIAAGKAGSESEETTHFSVIDRWGNAVACTTTLNGSFGSMVVASGTGVLLNNEMDDFSIKPGVPNMYGVTGGEANAIKPGKRMLSSMTPTILLDGQGEVYMITGSPGGSTIITTVMQTILNVVDHELPLAKAVYAPRFHHQWLPDVTYYESFGFSQDTLRLLGGMGHTVMDRGNIGDVHAILKDTENGVYLAVSDPRRGGAAKCF